MRAVKAKSTSGREPARAIDADVLVVGGGIVGCTVACALGQAGFSVVLADRERWERFTDPRFDGRAFAIALASRRMFEGLGVWRHAGREAAAILEIRVSERGSRKYLHYDHREVGPEPFGHMVEARTLRRALAFRLAKLGGVHLLAPMTVEGLRTTDTGVEALLADGRRVRAALSVASDGRASRTRAGAGIRVTGWDYPQTAIICTIAHEHPHGNVAHEHFLPAGPFAILPLNGRRSAIVWTERRELAPAIMALDADAFRDELADRVGTFLGRIEPVGPRWAHALSLAIRRDRDRASHRTCRRRAPCHAPDRRPGLEHGASRRRRARRRARRRPRSRPRYRVFDGARALRALAVVSTTP